MLVDGMVDVRMSMDECPEVHVVETGLSKRGGLNDERVGDTLASTGKNLKQAPNGIQTIGKRNE